MQRRYARFAFATIALLAIAAAVFRIATAPERVRDRRNTAHDVCVSSGGEWTVVDGEEICKQAALAIRGVT